MLIKWNPVRLNVVPVPQPKNKEAVDGKNKVYSRRSSITLLPGINEVPDDLWDDMQVHLKHHIEAGNIEVIKGKEQGKSATSLRDVSTTGAGKVIKATNDLNLLKRWLDIEVAENDRAKVREAARKASGSLATGRPVPESSTMIAFSPLEPITAPIPPRPA